ncbi:DNA-(apurinic or apyrimidinic site) lyase, chloroplastic [Gracilariopsis chorda]|uniref:DNA-(Apurinic or apyrimidinic site) lyase, chloroplastic n=1 Tax=Gracilariopsis chorda TaxID=448386 RepID=A0A2V3IMJ4_9FLOR|nr:DNA-(apurinic or apyrimidinic site) lyase, chloroplastic [Gracilariopsis chorda]|eukprot:PXF43305.1 DNA-(apurinic or apyrimidinic site) lyase, chloroplastic [Gracilariopsis chorda]
MATPRNAFCAPLSTPDLRNRTTYVAPTMCTPSTHTNTKKLLSWNVNGLRALLRKDPRALSDLVHQYDPDIVCLQETKIQTKHEKLFKNALPGYEALICNSSTSRLGYSGTATFSRLPVDIFQRQINHGLCDDEGRFVMIEYPSLSVINVYSVNSGQSLKRLPIRMTWDQSLRKMIRLIRRNRGKPVLVLGDLNVARHEIDVYNAERVQGRAGYTDLERRSFEDTLETCGLVDVFRTMHPDKRVFTYWDYKSNARQRNHGWRIDYALVSDDMLPAVRDVHILDHVTGSDHCPVLIEVTNGIL